MNSLLIDILRMIHLPLKLESSIWSPYPRDLTQNMLTFKQATVMEPRSRGLVIEYLLGIRKWEESSVPRYIPLVLCFCLIQFQKVGNGLQLLQILQMLHRPSSLRIQEPERLLKKESNTQP